MTPQPGPPHPSGRTYARTYERVRRTADHAYVEQAVARAGGRVLHSSGPATAPLFLVVEDDNGRIGGLMVYAFRAKRNVTRNRPKDEHRLQIRYGDVNDAAWREQHHPVGFDPTGLETTLLLGVEPDHDVIVGLDPLLYDPLPLGISVFWKDAHVAAARADGWHVFGRDNMSGARRNGRRTGLGLETVVMLSPERLFDLVRLEQQAQALALDPALRFRAAVTIRDHAGGTDARHASDPLEPQLHKLEEDYDLPASEILQIISERSRLAMAVRGGVAEHHAGRQLKDDPDVREARLGHQEGPPDFWVTLQGGRQVTVEVKNASPLTYADGTPKVEVQKTRASRGDPLSRLYSPRAFDVIAVCMFGPLRRWEFRYRRSALLQRHKDHPDRIAPLQRVTDDWATSLRGALEER